MKANELMIGDWVNVTQNPIKTDAVYQHTIYDIYGNNYSDEYISPIQLTEDILKENGFVNKNPLVTRTTLVNEYGNHRSVVYVLPNRRLHIWYDTHKVLNVKCSAVHELQHALRLCGLNELADNFKLN